VVYDVLRLTPFYKAFLVTTDVHEIYMQEFWATTTVHHHSIRFKMNNKKRIINLEYFREMLHICLRIPNQTFDELPFEKEILAFLRYLGHSGEIKKIMDVNINKLHQPWRSFAVVINKCLSGKSTGHDSLRLSQAQILWGMYHKKNVNFTYLLWEDFVYQVKHKDSKNSNEMYYPRFTKVIINFFMTKDPSILRRNKVNWNYVRDDQMFTRIKLVSRHQNTQQFGAMLPVELTNEDIRNSAAYKEYYAIASRAAPPNTKASVRKMQSSSDTIMPPPTAAGTRFSTSAKRKQPAKSSKAKGLYVLFEVALTEAEQIKLVTKRSLQQTHISQASGSGADEGTDDDDDVDDQSDANDDDDDDQEDKDEQDDDDQGDNDDDQDSDNGSDDFVHPKLSIHDEEAKDEESFDPIVQTPSQVENSDDESNDDASHGMNVWGKEGPNEEDDDDEELYIDVNINLEGRDVQMTDVHTTQVLEDTHVTLTPVNPDGINSIFKTTHRVDVPVSTTVVPLLVTAPTLPPPSIPIMSQVQQEPAPTLTTALCLDSTIVKKTINEQLEVEVLTRSSKSSKTSYDMAVDLSELELKKIIIEKMESNKSIHQSDEQRNLYKALADAYECDKIILDTYRDTVTLKRNHDDADKDEEPSAGSDRGSKRRREGKELESTSAPKEKASKTTSKSTEGSKSHQKTASESAPAEERMQTTQDLEEPSHQELEIDVLVTTTAEPPLLSLTTLPPPSILFISHVQQTPDPSPTNVLSSSLQDLPNFSSLFKFDHRLKTLETKFSEFIQTNQFAKAISSIPGIIDKYLDHRMNEAIKIIREQVKEQVKIQVSKILPKIERNVNEHLEAEVLTRSSNSSKTSHGVTTDLSELELKKILIDKMESNKSIHKSDEQKNLYKALVNAYECDKLILNTYGDTVRLKRRRDDEDKDEEPSAGSNRGESARDVYSKRRIIVVTELQIVEWHDYKYLDWIIARRDDGKLYKFKEANFKRLRIQDIEDMLLLLVQGKLTNLTVEECFAFNVTLRMFTRSTVIQQRVENIQLGVESY
nr:hypothetical protein [Tanacetum cinerariifolium]